MEPIFALLPDLLLAIMGLLGLVRARRFQNAFAAAAALFGVEEERLYSDVELFIGQRWEELFAALDVHGRGPQYFVGEAAERRPNALLLEAACRLKEAQLTVWDMERHECSMYGHHGPMYTAAIHGGQFFALMGQPLIPWCEGVAREAEPGTSELGREQPRIILPVQIAPDVVALVPRDGVRPDGMDDEQRERRSEQPMEPGEMAQAEHQPEANLVQAAESNERAQWLEDLAVRYRTMLRPRGRPVASAERLPQKKVAKMQPDFAPANITAMPAHFAAELVAPVTPPYIVRNNKIFCRLEHCGVPEREFETVGAWRKHVALARSHIEDAFCASCGHHLIVPPGMDRANIRAFIAAHKKERCIAAPKTTMRHRRTEIAWLDGLMRTTSHILLPGMEEAEAPAEPEPQPPAEPEPQPPAVRRKRHYETEEARRADVCAAYLKRFKAIEPELMGQIARDYQLQLP